MSVDVLMSLRAPITELMKTPSRTQTAKKTRVATTAARDRTEKVKGLNARLGLSPIIMSPTSQVLHHALVVFHHRQLMYFG